tara:strand:+ start:13656 stop:14234 length:579 start_codon:yes stop_codon:yes gene_type:complete
MILIFFGPPGAGKGTQADLISNEYKLPHLSTGNIFRNKLLENDQVSINLKKIIDSGELISDQITNKIVSERIEKDDCNKGFILDGYPRTIDQAIFLDKKLKEKKLSISKIIDIKIDKKTIIDRIKSRSNIENRKDDNEEVLETRISKYQTETKPLSDYYKSLFPLDYHDINGDQEIKKINRDILNFLKNADF